MKHQSKQNHTGGVVRLGVAGAMILAALAGTAAGSDVSDAAGRLADARAAYEAALAELRAAEAELAAAEAAESGGEAADGVRSDSAASTAEAAAESQPEGDVPAEATEPDPGFLSWDGWEKSIDIGVTGSSGNSENLNLRIQLTGERNTEDMETKASALYRLSKQGSDTTENRFRFDVFNDWLPPEGSKIRWWAKGAYEYDEFQAWDHRVSASAGIGYEFIDNDKHTLVGRLGFGGSQTFGDEDEDFRPEAVAGLDYTFNIKEGQQFTAGTEFLVDVSDTDAWRNNTYAQYEALIDAESGMNFKTGVTNRYDSEPGDDTKKNDLEYFATLGWTF